MQRLHELHRNRRGEKLGAAWRSAWLVLYLPVSRLVRVRYLHADRIPRDGPAIIVVNHVSHVDPFLIAKFVLDAGRVPRFLAKESIFGVPVVGRAMRSMGHIPVKRGSVQARQSLAAAEDALQQGKVIVLHPEGTVTRDPHGWPMAGRTGAARLATLSPDVPVIPVAQWGVQDQIDLYRRRLRLIPRPRHVISVGTPVDLTEFGHQQVTGTLLRGVSDKIMRTLRDDVAELRGEPAPDDELYRWTQARRTGDAA